MGSIKLNAVEKWFDTAQVIKGVDLEINDGEFIVFVGPSGCGKSTLLRMIGGLEDISRGTMDLDGIDVTDQPPSKRGLSMVFQSYALYPHLSVRDNMGFSLKSAGAPSSEINEKPTAFLFDEPLSNLDASLRVEMRYEIAKLHRSLAATMIYVTHDQVEAMTLADRIVVLNEGKIIQVGTPRELYNTPANIFVAQFIGSPKMNVLPCECDNGSYRPLGGRSAQCSLSSNKATQVGIRPEHITLVNHDQGQCSGQIEIVEYLGADTFIVVDCGSTGLVSVRISGETELRPGDTTGLAFENSRLVFFDPQGDAL